MALDQIPKQAGVYRLTFKLWGNTYTYIGEAGGRGFAITRTILPPRATRAEHLLHDLLQEAGEANLTVCCTGVTLGEQKARRNFGKEAVAATRQERLMCFNKGGYSVDVPMRRFVLKSEEKMLLWDLERVRVKLAKLDWPDQAERQRSQRALAVSAQITDQPSTNLYGGQLKR